MFPQLVVWPIRPWLVQSFPYLRAASFGVWGLKVVLAWWEASTREKIKLHFSCPETIPLVFAHTLWIWLAVSQIRGETTPVPHNMYLPLGMESQGTKKQGEPALNNWRDERPSLNLKSEHKHWFILVQWQSHLNYLKKTIKYSLKIPST